MHKSFDRACCQDYARTSLWANFIRVCTMAKISNNAIVTGLTKHKCHCVLCRPSRRESLTIRACVNILAWLTFVAIEAQTLSAKRAIAYFWIGTTYPESNPPRTLALIEQIIGLHRAFLAAFSPSTISSARQSPAPISQTTPFTAIPGKLFLRVP